MKALSIQQPWAWAILHAGKDVENRTWGTNFRGEILIHAGKKFDERGHEWLYRFLNRKVLAGCNYQKGGIVGKVEIIDCVTEMDSPWFFGPYGLVLANPVPLDFYPCKGKLGFFEVEYPG